MPAAYCHTDSLIEYTLWGYAGTIYKYSIKVVNLFLYLSI